MWDSHIIDDEENPSIYVERRSLKNWAIWDSLPQLVINIISLAFILVWGLLGIPANTPAYLNMLFCLIIVILSLVALVYSRYRHSSCLIGLVAFVQGARVLSALAWGNNWIAQQILASVEYIVMVRIITVISREYFGQGSRHVVSEDPSPLEMEEDAPHAGPHFLIDDNTGMIDPADVTQTNTTHNSTQAQGPLPGHFRLQIQNDASSDEENEDLEDMASGKESDEGTFGEVPLDTVRGPHHREEHHPLHERAPSLPSLFPTSIEQTFLALLVSTNVIFCILVFFESKNIPLITVGITCSSWLVNLFGAAVIVLEILKVRSIYADVLGSTHAHGFSFLVLLGAVFVRVLIRVVELAFSVSDAIGDGKNPFLAYGIESLLVILPLALHFYTIYYEDAAQNLYKVKLYFDGGKRYEAVYYVVLMNLHLIAIGHAFESRRDMGKGIYDPSFPSPSPSFPALLSCSYAAALVSCVDLALLLLGSLSPLVQLLAQISNFGFARQKIQNHRDAACSALLFASLHILFHVIQWIISPYLQFHSKPIYSPANPSFITGILAVTGFFGAILTAFRFGVHARAHLLFVALGFIALFCHGYQGVLESSLGTLSLLSLFVVSIFVYTLFFVFYPLRVQKICQTTWERAEFDQFALLEFHCENSNSIPPGAYCNIFGPNQSYISLFRGQPFPVFCSQDRRITFLVHCAKLIHYPNFLAQLSIQKPLYLHIQGPFQSQQAKSFISYLGSQSAPCDVYLCGWSSGVAPLFSLLWYLRENARFYPIQRICCLITKFSERRFRAKIRQHIDFFVRHWVAPFPVAIVEAPSDDVSYIRDAKKVAGKFYKTIEEEMVAWKEEIPVSKTRRWVVMGEHAGVRSVNNKKVLYFCGEEFDYSLFPKKEEWQIFVESIPVIHKGIN